MSVKDMIKKSVLESGVFDQYNISSILVALAAALALGILIFLVYRRFYTGVIYSRTFAVTLVGMTVLTCMVTLAISTNVVISLGMVGALSIVRFRTAVKDPMDLLYLFWAITTGITAGAGMYVLALLAAAIMIFMIILFYSRQQRGKIYIAVIHYSGDEAGDEVIRCFGKPMYACMGSRIINRASFCVIAFSMRSSERVSSRLASSITSTRSRSASASIKRGLTVSPSPSSAVW